MCPIPVQKIQSVRIAPKHSSTGKDTILLKIKLSGDNVVFVAKQLPEYGN
jgi:hypothetical protein